MPKRREIRNSTAEFQFFQAEDKGQGVEVLLQRRKHLGYTESNGNIIQYY